ncbi:hypothetical protein A0128_12665 [Leptospira tipperaryensis]|uniref:Uncharacterized protein n=1 Tax=Leptospira tipperaryensis TaxID=2564040 RepID=A0A1D7UYF0_9LEPT|nr:hypothetical protein A0128_12665 [Leptospira tipperaryensis]
MGRLRRAGPATFTKRLVGVPTKEFLLAKLEFCDIGKSPVVFSATRPSSQDLGGARDFHSRSRNSDKDLLQNFIPDNFAYGFPLFELSSFFVKDSRKAISAAQTAKKHLNLPLFP